MASYYVQSLIIGILVFLATMYTEGQIPIFEDTFSENASQLLVDYRLPSNIYPLSYEIFLSVQFQGNFTFTGRVQIYASVTSATNTIVLHYGKMTDVKANVWKGDRTLLIKDTSYDAITEKYTINLLDTLHQGDNVFISVSYIGMLNDDMIGFYRSSYIDSYGTIRWLAATQFQTTHARYAFPCFDEPHFKATFSIIIERDSRYSSISNMPVLKREMTEDYRYRDYFAKSIPMSTYLVAFVISDFSNVKSDNFRVWAQPSMIKQANYALQIGPRALEYLSQLFQQPYQLPKMDMVAVPDFAAGAMENWGLITYRETRLLYEENESSAAAQQSVAAVIVHEITHMWFGNLVTPVWWSYLWLSEAFARYYQYYATQCIETTWNMDQQFLVDQYQAALDVDSLESSKPMTRDVASQSQISEMGDSITYSKGASIVRMMKHIVGFDNFDWGLQNYLRANKIHGTARPENLWAALQNVTTQPISIATVMTTWTTQAGFPVLSVSVDENGKATLQQRRFILRNLKYTPTNLTWWIPITYTTKSRLNFDSSNIKHWLKDKSEVIEIDIDLNKWILFNVQQSGFYRVNYDNSSWYRLIDALYSDDFKKIHENNRAGIVDDLMNLARAELLPYETAFDGLQYLEKETNYLPLKTAIRNFEYLTQRFAGQNSAYSTLKKYILKLFANVYQNLGYYDRPNDDRLTVHLRRDLNQLACKLDKRSCISASLRAFSGWRADAILRIKPNQRTTSYCMGILYGNKDDWEFLWNEYNNSKSANEQAIILRALGCSQDTDILEKYLQYAITPYEESKIRKQDSTNAFAAVYSSSLIGASYVIDFITKNHIKMKRYYGDYDTIGSILSGASKYFSTEELISQFENLIKTSSDFQPIRSTLDASLKLAKYELEWYKKHSISIVTWIEDHYKASKPLPSEDSTNYRLPTNILPTRYVISIRPYIYEKNFTFDGTVEITADVVQKTNKIILHSLNITHHDTKIIVNDEELSHTTNTSEKYDFYIINLAKVLPAKAKLKIKISYTGHLNKEMNGFYRSSYVTDSGDTRWLAVTQLEPVGARKLVPCFDEPALKSIFSVNVLAQKNYHAISNTKVKNISNYKDGSKQYFFADTPNMSTYLLVLVVSDFHKFSEKSTVYNVWARSNAIDQAEYAFSAMKPLVNFFENSLNHKYQLPKLDMVALPDFTSGAMENWGLLTYREKYVLFNANESSTASQQSIANVISHEIAHQWFGNLVSPLWWKYIWLNEGFASYFEYFGTASFETTWELEHQFVIDQVHSALQADSSESSHPMTHDVYSPTEIGEMFDSISYAKSGSVLRMTEKTFGSDIFYKALHEYLKARAYNVATDKNLYEAIEKQISDVNLRNKINTIMDSWTTQAGYPIVQVSRRNDLEVVQLTQERFLLKNTSSIPIDTVWHVPITWTSENDINFNETKPKYWLTTPKATIVVNLKPSKWVIFNVQQAGFYRVNYDKTSWEEIFAVLKSANYKTIHKVNRAMLIDDLMNLGRAEYINYDTVLSGTEYLSKERDYLPWRAFLNGLSYLHKRFDGRDGFDIYKKHIKTLLRPISEYLYDNIDIDEDSLIEEHTLKLLRMQIRTWACKYNIGNCASYSASAVKKMIEGKLTSLHPNYRSAVYCTGIRNGESNVWDYFWEKYLNAKVTADKIVILNALGCSRNKTKLHKILVNAIKDNSDIRSQDSSTAFNAVYDASLIGVDYTMEFIKLYFDDMYKYYGSYSSIKSILNSLATRLSTENLYKKYKDLNKWISTKVPSLRRSLESYEENALYELNWYSNNAPSILHWIENRYPEYSGYRLPTSSYPLKYNIMLSLPNFYYFDTFNGNVQIDIKVNEPTYKIVLNSHELNISKISVYETPVNQSSKNINYLRILKTTQESKTQKLIIYMQNYIEVPKVTVEISYVGNINLKMQGIYLGSYHDKFEITRYYVATYMQPNYARMVFPCFDEPAFKATFKLSIERDNTMKTLSNMRINSTYPSKTRNCVWDVFEDTPQMSTYLVAFVISKFVPVRNKYEKFNVWGRESIVKYSNDVQYKTAEYVRGLTDYTNIEQPIEKFDLVGLPSFPIGAMENWGLVTFKEYGLFYDEHNTPASHRIHASTMIAHELTHMWLGNLVTCEWWEFTWLNEGFAQYFQWLLQEPIESNLGISAFFVPYEMHKAMQIDILRKSHPMNYHVLAPAELANAFDKIAYQKAASVIHMLHHAFGDITFKYAIREYLDNRSYLTATPKDLWNAFQKNIEKHNLNLPASVDTIMSTWTNQSGYPVVLADFNSSSGVVTVSQACYLCLEHKYFWIPLTLMTDSKQFNLTSKNPIWLGNKKVLINTTPKSKWFIINVQQTGYYRVNYDQESWYLLIKNLNSEYDVIPELNRAQLIDDSFNLARSGQLSYEIPLQIVKFLLHDYGHLSWKAFASNIDHLDRLFNTYNDNSFEQFIRDLSIRHFKYFGFKDKPNESISNELNRELILSISCKYGNTECIETSQQIFLDSLTSSRTIPRNVKSVVYCTALKHGYDFEWRTLLNMLPSALPTERNIILDALGCTRRVDDLKSLLIKAALTKDFPKQDISRLFASVYNSGTLGVNVTLEFLMDNYLQMYELHKDWNIISTQFTNVVERIGNRFLLKKFNFFMYNNKANLKQIWNNLEIAVEIAKNNLMWNIANYDKILLHLQDVLNEIKPKVRPNHGISNHEYSIMYIMLISILTYFLT